MAASRAGNDFQVPESLKECDYCSRGPNVYSHRVWPVRACRGGVLSGQDRTQGEPEWRHITMQVARNFFLSTRQSQIEIFLLLQDWLELAKGRNCELYSTRFIWVLFLQVYSNIKGLREVDPRTWTWPNQPCWQDYPRRLRAIAPIVNPERSAQGLRAGRGYLRWA
jgi:hypothetical protein